MTKEPLPTIEVVSLLRGHATVHGLTFEQIAMLMEFYQQQAGLAPRKIGQAMAEGYPDPLINSSQSCSSDWVACT